MGLGSRVTGAIQYCTSHTSLRIFGIVSAILEIDGCHFKPPSPRASRASDPVPFPAEGLPIEVGHAHPPHAARHLPQDPPLAAGPAGPPGAPANARQTPPTRPRAQPDTHEEYLYWAPLRFPGRPHFHPRRSRTAAHPAPRGVSARSTHRASRRARPRRGAARLWGPFRPVPVIKGGKIGAR